MGGEFILFFSGSNIKYSVCRLVNFSMKYLPNITTKQNNYFVAVLTEEVKNTFCPSCLLLLISILKCLHLSNHCKFSYVICFSLKVDTRHLSSQCSQRDLKNDES